MIQFSIDNKKVIFFFLAILLIGGVLAFGKLGKKEDAPFVIKQAVVMVSYPGASASEVEQKITRVVERKLQTMSNIYKISSDSYQGLSKITVELQPYTPPGEIPQMWDVLRRKLLDIEPSLPTGSNIAVNDDFGDVFGLYYGLKASMGYDYDDLRYWAREIERELSVVDGVQQVTLFGVQSEVVELRVSLSKLATLNITPDQISQIIALQNRLLSVGERDAGGMEIKFYADGVYKSIEDIKNQVLISSESGQIKVKDIAEVKLSYATPPKSLMFVNGEKSVSIAISSPKDRDVVLTGKNVKAKLSEIRKKIPAGIEIVSLYAEDEIAHEANVGFIFNLLISIAIVVLVLMVAMGFRSSLLIGSSLLFSISGTMLIMQFMGVGLNRTSLAGFIIAMGMLVDNAIVVTDNAQNNLKRGLSLRNSIISGAKVPMWGLLGATMIAVFSFLPLYLAKASVAEIVQPLFVVIGVSLLLSWLLALTQTTSFAMLLFKERKESEKPSELFTGKIYLIFEKILKVLLRRRYATITAMVALLFLSLFVMGRMPQNFFPNLDKEYFRAEIFLPNGSDITYTERCSKKMEQWLLCSDKVVTVSRAIGSSPPRYYLASGAYGPMASYAALLVELTSKDYSHDVEMEFNSYVRENFPNVVVKSSLFKVSPVAEATIEIGFTGENIDTLTALTSRVKEIMRDCEKVDQVRDSWGNKIAYLTPRYSKEKGGRLGISRQTMAQSYSVINNGLSVGSFGLDDQYIPIKMISSDDVFNLNDVANIPISTPSGRTVALSSITSSIDYNYQYYNIRRLNHSRIMFAQCEPKRGGNSVEAFSYIFERAKNEITLPEGYSLTFKGERESQVESNEALAENFPLTLILIFITLLLLFRNYKTPIVILSMIPLIFIGVVLGLVVTGKMFDFFSILGVLGLVGMNIKNAVVLVDQIGFEIKAGASVYEAVIMSAKSRLIPVVMASGTTILGMLPLLYDAMFGGMAATIMGGLFVATLLTMFILPVAYSIAYNVKK